MSGRVINERIPRTPILFGTDGWRAVIAHEFTFANLERVAQAYADFLNQPQPQQQDAQVRRANEATAAPHVVVGYDRRFLSEKFAERAAEVLAGNGITVAMFESDVPTP